MMLHAHANALDICYLGASKKIVNDCAPGILNLQSVHGVTVEGSPSARRYDCCDYR